MILSRLALGLGAVALPTLVLRGATIGVQFAVMVALAATLGMERFGELALYWAAAQVAAQILSFGAPTYLLGGYFDLRRLLWLLVLGPVAVAVIAGAAMPAVLPSYPWGAVFVCALGLNGVSGVASLWRSRGQGNLAILLRDAGPYVALFAMAFWFANTAMDLTLLSVGAICGGFALASLVLFVAAGRDDKSSGPWHPSIWTGTVAGVGLAHVDILILGAVAPAEALGFYALVKRVANLTVVPVSVATWVTAPRLARALRAGDTTAAQAQVYLANRIALVWWFPLALGAVCVGLTMPEAFSLLAVLVVGGLVQAYVAAAIPTSTLGPAPTLASHARMLSLAAYLIAALVLWPVLTPLANAVLYVLAQVSGAIYLRRAIADRLGIETAGIGAIGRRREWRMS